MNIERLKMLKASVEKRKPGQFNQDYAPHTQNIECGCAIWNAKKLFGYESTSALCLSQSQWDWIFGNIACIKSIAEENDLDISTSFGPLDAAQRIQDVIDGEVK